MTPRLALGLGEILVRSLAVPPHRRSIVLRHPLALGVHDPEIVLGKGVTLVGKFSHYS